MPEQEKRWEQKVREEALSPADIEARAFKIEEIPYKGRAIKLVSIESVPKYVDNQALVPDDWGEQVSAAMEDTSLVFVSFFPPELERTLYSSQIYGRLARILVEPSLNDIYQPVADLAAKKGKPVAVSDIANKVAYPCYETLLLPNGLAIGMEASAGAVDITSSEKYVPLPVDARRMFTAKGIMQEAERYPEGSSFLYVAAPAHVTRVKRYITEEPTRMDSFREKVYGSYIGLDKNTRIYKPTPNGWLRISNAPIK